MPALDATFITIDLPDQCDGILPVPNAPLATADLPGIVQPDGTTITVDPTTGIISALGSTAGLTITITTAKLTALGSNGSMTFTKGILTAQTPAT